MAMDTPARIAVLGCGPIGLEAALYARFLGYDVTIIERAEVAEHVRQWGHIRMFSPFRLNRSSLGLAALNAQDPQYEPPDDDALLTGHEWRERYLLPLAHSDLIEDHLRLETRVVSVSRNGCLKQDPPGAEERGESRFRLLLERAEPGEAGQREEDYSDIVIDTTGVFQQPNWMGSGGSAALGESHQHPKISYHAPDPLHRDRERFAGKHVLVVGAGHSAATMVCHLVTLQAEEPSTRIHWSTRRPANGAGPMVTLENDRLPERSRLSATANQHVSEGRVSFRPDETVSRIETDPASDRVIVHFSDPDSVPVTVDEIIALVGYRPDRELYQELHVHECYSSEGPIKLAAHLMQNTSADCLDQVSSGPQMLLNPEPNFYVLGAKSYGRHPHFLVSIGLEQIRSVFSIIGDREDLNLYENGTSLPK